MHHVIALVMFAMTACGHFDLLHANDAATIHIQMAHLVILVAGELLGVYGSIAIGASSSEMESALS